MHCTAAHINNTMGNSNVPFFLLRSPNLHTSCSFFSTNYCVYAYLRHAVQKYHLSGGNYAKADKCPVKQMKHLRGKLWDFFFFNSRKTIWKTKACFSCKPESYYRKGKTVASAASGCILNPGLDQESVRIFCHSCAAQF